MITVFLPCRAGSERVPHKNTKPFAGIEGGLIFLKLKTLLKIKAIDQIVVSTNDDRVIEVALSFESPKIKIDQRPEYLASSRTSTDELIQYVPQIIKEGHILWTHVTSPFFDQMMYEDAIENYFRSLTSGFDSLMSVNKIQSFLWKDSTSFNYDRDQERWPRTQTIEPIYEVNSGVFLNSIENYKSHKDRIGLLPYMYETQGLYSFDIDWQEDFDLAEKIYLVGNG